MIFFKGDLPSREQKTLSIVGTRHPTPRGKEFTKTIIHEIAGQDPSVVIISGLAYGIDIQAHLTALETGLSTIAVLGHGFHTLYPAIHRDIAKRITGQGGLVTDFFSHNLMEPKNFIRRNRIIAGMAEATLVIESGVKGGAVVTAEMAVSYDRDLFAIPGRPEDPMSAGCNYLIRSSQATLVQSAEELLLSAGWQRNQVKKNAPEAELFNTLEPEERMVFDLIGQAPLSLDQLAREVSLPVQTISAIALSLEFKGLIHGLPGQQYFR
jgi:DNA processing protein